MQTRTSQRLANAGLVVAAVAFAIMVIWIDLSPKPRASPALDRIDLVDSRAEPLPRIPPGTVVNDHPPEGWSHLIFKSRSELATGDLDAVPEWSKELSRFLFTALLARVRQASHHGQERYRLEGVSIGLGTRIGERDVIISSATQQTLGANLGPIKRIILGRAEERLNEVVRVARTDTMIVFDAPQTMLSEGRHRMVVFRYVVLVNPGDGRLATFVWRIDLGRDGSYRLAPGAAVLMKPNLLATCALHVDKREFTAGIPTPLAFATTRLPAGDPIELPRDLHGLAGQKRFNEAMVRQLESGLREIVAFPPRPA
jgi:hypothetical protein